jgi:hypothetical protein
MWELHFGPIPKGLSVLHHCDEPSCINPFHLFLGTQAENMADATQKDRVSRGKDRWNVKLTAAKVRMIRNSREPQTLIARRFNVCQGTVSAILRRRIWRYVK